MRTLRLCSFMPALAFALPMSSVAGAQLCVRSEDQKVVSSDLQAGDIYGAAVAVDGGVAFIAGEYDDLPGTDSGAVYVYDFDGTDWLESDKLEASDAQAGDNFGRSVSLDGDVAVVGAHWDDDQGSKSGSAYVFRYDGAVWVEEQKLLASDGEVEGRFGNTVAVAGDLIGVGSWLHGSGGEGAVYMFRYDGSAWVEEQKLTASDAAAGDNFGRYVSVSGNVAIVGAWKDDDSGTSSGSAYMFRFNGTNWIEEQKLTASDAAGGDLFGWAAYVDGDVAVVGAYADDDHGSESGSAYVFEYSGGSWSQAQKLTPSDGSAGEWFGYSLDLVGDWLLISAPVKGTAVGSGSAYLYRHDGSQWGERRRLEPSDGANQDKFGFHVALADNVALSGAWRDDDAGANSGSAYFYEFGDAFANPLGAAPCALSLASGGSQSMVIDMGAAHAGSFYWIFGSVTGTSPGVGFPGGIHLPLNFDAYFNLTLTHPFLGIFNGFLALLDGDGKATAALTLPPGADPGLAGVTLYHALTVSAVFGTVDATSNAIEVLLDS